MDVRPPLADRRVVTTRDEPGDLDDLLTRAGAEVVHVPLIEIVDPPDPTALEAATAALRAGDWVVVTSKHGARRIGPLLDARTGVRLAAVGRATADELALHAGRPPDVVPDIQTAADLVAELSPRIADGERVLVAQADRAEPTLVDGLRRHGHLVVTVIAYVNRLRALSPSERSAVADADAVVFASGSAATSWARGFGTATPPVVVAIGPSTANAARAAGLKVTHVAADHSIAGLAAEVVGALGRRP